MKLFPIADFELVDKVLNDFYKKKEEEAKEGVLALMNTDPTFTTYLGSVYLYYEREYDAAENNLISIRDSSGFKGFGDYYYLLAASYKELGNNQEVDNYIKLTEQSQTFMFSNIKYLKK